MANVDSLRHNARLRRGPRLLQRRRPPRDRRTKLAPHAGLRHAPRRHRLLRRLPMSGIPSVLHVSWPTRFRLPDHVCPPFLKDPSRTRHLLHGRATAGRRKHKDWTEQDQRVMDSAEEQESDGSQ